MRERVDTALALNTEAPSVEFKAGAKWDTLKAAIVKTALAMSNLLDGGLIIVGRPEDTSLKDGVSAADLESYDPDIMRDQFDAYASPRVVVSIAQFDLAGSLYVAIDVSGFEEDPVVCKKDLGPDRVLRQGAIYIRPFGGRPRTVPIATAEEMRSVVELAIDKRSAAFEARARRRGYERNPGDAACYSGELADLE